MPPSRAPAPVLMIVGTGSSVGKSVIVAALCRIFRQDGVRVAPFKAQNTSNNADVTDDGLEIGRAQSEQAAAAGLAPSVDMNPILLKPQGDRTSQIVVAGRPAGLLHAADFVTRKRDLWPVVEGAIGRLRSEYDLVIAEGAGAAIEPNLRDGDIVNLRVARHAAAVTLLVGDIDRGGVFAQLLGTLEWLTAAERACLHGFIINRFRGDPALLASAVTDLESRTGLPMLGVIPWIDDLRLAEEDAVTLERAGGAPAPARGAVDIAVIRFPRIANFDDFDPLGREPEVRLRYVERADELGTPDLMILPGTKATIADLAVLRERKLDIAIRARVDAGGHVLGICGGFQMLGEHLVDPDGAEGLPGTRVAGLGLLPVCTVFSTTKVTRRTTGHVTARTGPWSTAEGLSVHGYEIHMGRTSGTLPPLLRLSGHADGAVSLDGRVAGTYLHGLWHNDDVRTAILAGLGRAPVDHKFSSAEHRDAEFDRVAAVVRRHLNLARVRHLLKMD